MNEYEKNLYVISMKGDGHDAFAIRFHDSLSAWRFMDAEEQGGRTVELMTEEEFLDEYTKPDEYFPDEETAKKVGFYYDDEKYGCWIDIGVDDIDE